MPHLRGGAVRSFGHKSGIGMICTRNEGTAGVLPPAVQVPPFTH